MRFETTKAGFFDGVSATVSVNRQADGRLEQARPGQRIDEQVNTTTALGYSLQATRDWSARFRTLVGGEIFDEDIAGSRTFHEPDGSTVRARPDIPDGTQYRTSGLFIQQSADVIPDRLTLRGGLRFGHYVFKSTRDVTLGVPEQDIPVSDTTFNASGVYAATPDLTFTMSVSRGFRAANAFDFGAIGLSGGAGFEISPLRAVELSGVRGSTDGATAISTGQPVGDLDPERLMAYEAGIRWRTGRVSTSVTAFDLEFHDAIERRTLIFPSSIVGLDLSGYTVIRQDEIGRAYVAGEARPIVTRVNVSRSRILGYEAETNVQITAPLRARAWASMARGTELETNSPRRRMPPGMGGATLTWQPCGRPLVGRGDDGRGDEAESPERCRHRRRAHWRVTDAGVDRVVLQRHRGRSRAGAQRHPDLHRRDAGPGPVARAQRLSAAGDVHRDARLRGVRRPRRRSPGLASRRDR